MTEASTKQFVSNGIAESGERAPAMERIEWVTWQGHRRTANIAAYFGMPVKLVDSDETGVWRYLRSTVVTLRHLWARRPDVLIVQNPSLALACLAVLARPTIRYRLVVDAHNEAVQPFVHKHDVIVRLSQWVLREADLTIVTNYPIARVVEATGGVAAVLPDRIPDARPSKEGGGIKARVVLIATFAADEPVEQFLEAATAFQGSLEIFVTGKVTRASKRLAAQYSNAVSFTGFLPEEKYWSLLDGASFIADLTTMGNCLVCGAYEGVALEKPLLLSDSKATREHFRKGAIYVDNTVDGIRAGIATMMSERSELRIQVQDLKRELTTAWPRQARKVEKLILGLP